MRYIVRHPYLSEDVCGTTIVETLDEVQKNVFTPALLDNRNDEFTIDRVEVVEADMIAYSQDSVVHAINQLLPVKPSFCELMGSGEDIEVFGNLTSTGCPSLSGVTALVPYNRAVDLSPVELSYLMSKHGTEDRSFLVNQNILAGYYGGNFTGSVKNMNGDLAEFDSFHRGKDIVYNHKKAVRSNILASDGVVHIVDGFNVPRNLFNPRKYLYGLGCQDFVEQIEFRHLDELIEDNNITQTLLVYRDDEEVFRADQEFHDILVTSNHKNSLLYHFIDGKIHTQESGIYESKYCGNKKLGKACQRIKLRYSGGKLVINDDSAVSEQLYSVGNTEIFMINKDLNLPASLKHAVNSNTRCTKSMNYLEQFDLVDLKSNKNGYTIFLPCFRSWTSLDLSFDYLESNKTAMKLILKNAIVENLIYSDFDDDIVTRNLNNELIEIKALKEDSRDYNSLQVNLRKIYLEKYRDIVFDQGVVHPIEGVVIPPSVEITLTDLIKTAKSSQFLDLLEFANLSYVLTSPNYSIIVPSHESLIEQNFTQYTPLTVLGSFLRMHIIPNNLSDYGSNGTLLDCGSRIPTLLQSVHLRCTRYNKKTNFLQIVEGLDYQVRVLKSGCSTLNNNSCVLLTDKPILPDWLNTGKKLKFHLPLAAVGVGFICGILFIFLFVPCCLLFIIGTKGERISDVEDLSEDEQALLGESSQGDVQSTEDEPRSAPIDLRL